MAKLRFEKVFAGLRAGSLFGSVRRLPARVPPAVPVKLEEVLSYTGGIKVNLPTGEGIRLQHDVPLSGFLLETTVVVGRGRLSGLFFGAGV